MKSRTLLFLGSALQWRQFLLDNYARVSEVIASDALVRISPRRNGLGIHVLISDRTGDCASIEFLNGEMVVHTGAQLPIRVLTNDTYATSIYHWQKGKAPMLDIGQSIERFIQAAEMIENYDTDRFEIYTRQKNRTLIENSFRKTRFLRNYTDAAFDRLADFPDSMTCKP